MLPRVQPNEVLTFLTRRVRSGATLGHAEIEVWRCGDGEDAAAPAVIPRFRPNGANAIDYNKAAGHEITAHCDDRQLSGDILANLSLAGDAWHAPAQSGRSGGEGFAHVVLDGVLTRQKIPLTLRQLGIALP